MLKYCYCCKTEKEISLFGPNKSKPDGLADECRECKRQKDREYAARNREAAKKRASEWYYANKEEALRKHKIYAKEYIKKNRAYLTAKEAKRRGAKLQATPKWLTEQDLEKIKTEYKLCAWASSVMKEQYHVDHIVPLKGKLVCGLHVPWNLQVIPAKVNASKGNKHYVV